LGSQAWLPVTVAAGKLIGSSLTIDAGVKPLSSAPE
jgi:hypothetical protein